MQRNETREDALVRLMREHGDALLRLCALRLGDAALAEDAAQETFLRAWRGLDTFRGDASEKTWLTAIAINVCRDFRRAAWFRHNDLSKPVTSLPEPSCPDDKADDTVLSAVTALPARLREVALLRYYQGLTVQETAKALRLSPSAVKKRQAAANARLREQLKGWWNEDE